jgi:hypothetical protein
MFWKGVLIFLFLCAAGLLLIMARYAPMGVTP